MVMGSHFGRWSKADTMMAMPQPARNQTVPSCVEGGAQARQDEQGTKETHGAQGKRTRTHPKPVLCRKTRQGGVKVPAMSG
jgi:hypothetical protein